MATSLTMLALGDSPMWGNGLKERFKYVAMVAQDLADASGRSVEFITYAHSGATLASEDGCYEPILSTDRAPPGDLNAALPTARQQEAVAASQHPEAELVLLTGCINDVDATRIALPFPFSRLKPSDVRRLTHQRCADDMRELLEKTKGDFKFATVIVANYWLIISDKSKWYGLVMQGRNPVNFAPSERALYREAEGLLKTELEAERKLNEHATARRALLHPKGLFRRWSANSYAFLDTSGQCFDWAAAVADGKSTEANDPHASQCPKTSHVASQRVTDAVRVFLATVPTEPQYSYGAGKDKRLWSVAAVGPVDQLYDQRGSVCDSHYDEPAFLGERFICHVNPTAHPNVPGAEAYRQSMDEIMKIAWSK